MVSEWLDQRQRLHVQQITEDIDKLRLSVMQQQCQYLDAPVHSGSGKVLAVPVEGSRAHHVGRVGQVAVVKGGLHLQIACAGSRTGKYQMM